jgi:hypothetical protein
VESFSTGPEASRPSQSHPGGNTYEEAFVVAVLFGAMVVTALSVKADGTQPPLPPGCNDLWNCHPK